MSAITGAPFPTYFVSQEMCVYTFFSPKRNLIITQIRARFLNQVLAEYISLDWDQAKRWHERAVNRLINHGALIFPDFSELPQTT